MGAIFLETIDMQKVFYHGIVDWSAIDTGIPPREKVRLSKFKNILHVGQIVRPKEFRNYGIEHGDTANIRTAFFSFCACHPLSDFASRFRKPTEDYKGYTIATECAGYGFLLDPSLLGKMQINYQPFTDLEIGVVGNIPLESYGRGVYINPLNISRFEYNEVCRAVGESQFDFPIVNYLTGEPVVSLEDEKARGMAT